MSRVLFIVALFTSATLFAAPRSEYSLRETRFEVWPEGKVPSVSTNQTYSPYFIWFTPKETKVDMILISVSGGGYTSCGIDWFEVAPIRDYFLKKGVNVVTMQYRTPRPIGEAKHLTAWQDAQRTVRLVRAEAKRRGLDPENIGFTGCSAGGHLTLMVATSSSSNSYLRIDVVDDEPCHVNWAIPVYPAYGLTAEANNCDVPGCDNLNNPMVSEFRFDQATPPMCFFHGDADNWSPMASVRAYHRLRTMHIPVELHIMARQEHCFMWEALPGTLPETWKDRVWEWLTAMDFATVHPPYWPIKDWNYLYERGTKLEAQADFAAGSWQIEGRWRTPSANGDKPIFFRGKWTDFTLDFEYQPHAADSRSAVLCRADDGSIRELIPLQLTERGIRAWNHVTIWAKDGKFKLTINDKIVSDATLPFPIAQMSIGFAGRTNAAKTYFRNARIR